MMLKRWVLWILTANCAWGGAAAAATVTQQLAPARIALGTAAQLTIGSDDSSAQIRAPAVPGLEFIPVGQSRRVEYVNGVTRSTASVIYQVVPRQAGTFTIPGTQPGMAPVVLTVTAGNEPPASGGGPGANAPGMPGTPMAEVAAFVRIHPAKHELYVGENIPVDIEVGTHDGVVTAMNGPPLFSGEGIVLDPLTSEPQRSTEVIDGEPFTSFTWHSTLTAAKPGALSMVVKSPLTIRVRPPGPSARRYSDDPDDFFNDPNFRGLFGGVTEKEITVASKPDEFKVLALPTKDRPAGFSGAVGHFTVSSDLSADKGTVGDPLTLRLKITGTGNFDRVEAPMLHDPEHWKTYAPTSHVKRADDGGPKSEKIFEQPVIATLPGEQPLPSLSFSWFDPETRRYETANTEPLHVSIAPAAQGMLAQSAGPPPASTPDPQTPAPPAGIALRPDHLDTGRGADSLRPHYLEPAYLAAPSMVAMLVAGALLWLRRRDRVTDQVDQAPSLERLLEVMHQASLSRDAPRFFRAARTALQTAWAPEWQLAPEAITTHEVAAHFGEDSDLVRAFVLADESAYAGSALQSVDLQHWKHLILEHIADRVEA